MFTKEIMISDMIEKDQNGHPLINGSKLRSLHQNLQPRDTIIDFNIPPSLGSVEQKISGPSAEVRFGVQSLVNEDLDRLITFFVIVMKT